MRYYKQVFAGFNPDRPIIEVVETVESADLRTLGFSLRYAIDRISEQEIQSVRRIGEEYRTYEFPKLYMAVSHIVDGKLIKLTKDCKCISHMSPYPAYQMTHHARNLAEGLIDDLTGQGALGYRTMIAVMSSSELRVH